MLLLTGNIAGAITITANANGDWAVAGTWSLGRKPTCGDTIVIPAGVVVTVASQENLVPCGTPVVMYVHGTLQFTNGNKIDFPCGSWVYIALGGVVKKVTAGGGNSTLISICGYIEWNAGDGQLNGVDTLGGHGTLPVTWLTIEASMKGAKAEISWSTAAEVNNDYFDVMRSDDALSYEAIGRVNGNGNSTTTNQYAYEDPSPVRGINYYKLVQVDYDGTKNSSYVVAVNNTLHSSGIDDLHLSPNPVGTEAQLIFRSDRACSAGIEIKNASGQICLQQQVMVQKGVNAVPLVAIAKLAKGIYSLVISCIEETSRPLSLIKK